MLYAIERKRAEITAVELHASQLRAMENARLERGLSPSPLLLDNPGVDIIARYVPSRENTLLGGDFYDFVQTPDRTVHVMIGDVAGHGPDEAALGVALRIAWRALTFAGLRGPDRMRELDRILRTERAGKGIFATVLSLAIPPEGSQFRAVRAGHPGMLLHGGGTVDWLEPPGGPALGLNSGDWEYHQVEWPAGHRPGAAHRRTLRGAFGPRQRTPRRRGTARVGAFACGAARPGVRRRAHRGSRRARAGAHGGLTDDIAVVRVERTSR